MSWTAHNQAQTAPWNSAGIAMQDINSGPYTPEQWAIMQQQNWQQWTQWQQQYSQWQNQYGAKYAQQLQAVQNMGGIIPPPPPQGAAPPPPPDKPPPPPPPHENNQPLFNSNKDKPVPAPDPLQRNKSNYNTSTGNNQWSYSTDTQRAVNAEALKKLAEEERLFDIQFQKWEEEIDKWRQENVNHPDKQAYKDYEAKFEACRKQLLERRQQMKTKRATLLNNPAQANTGTTGNTSVPTPTPPKNSHTLSQMPQLQKNPLNNSYEKQYDSNNRNNKNVEPQDRYELYHQSAGQSNYSSQGDKSQKGNKTDTSTFLPSASGKGIPGLDLVPDSQANKKQEVIDLSDDQPDNQQKMAPDFSTITMGINNILGDEKIMNILSMVRGLKPTQKTDTSNSSNMFKSDNQQFLPNNQGNKNQNNSQPQQYENTMPNNRQLQFMQNQNMNSQYQPPNQGGNYNRQYGMQQDQYFDQNNDYGGANRGQNMRGPGGFSVPHGLGGPRGPVPSGLLGHGTGMQQGAYGIRQGGPGMQQGGPGMHQGGPGIRQGGPGMQQGGPGMQQGGSDMQQGGPGMQQGGPGMQQGGPGMQQGGSGLQQGGPGMQQGPGMKQSGPNMQQGGSNIQQGGSNMHQGGLHMQQGGPRMQQGGPSMQQVGASMQHPGPNMQQGGPNMQHGGVNNMQQGSPNLQQPQPLMANRMSMPVNFNNTPGRPQLQDVSSQQKADFYASPQTSIPPPQTPKHKWVEDPLFTPSIVVEYEHKSLRLKARDFIEPVHTFDYNHISKDNESKKKDFEHEADELFTRKPRRSERDYAEDRFRDHGSRDLYSRDYERRGIRDDFRDMPRDIREIRGESRDIREPREMRDSRDMRDIRESRDVRESRDKRESRDMRDMRQPRETRDMGPRDIRDIRGEPRDMREPRDFRDMREPRDVRELRDFRERDDRVKDDMNPRDRPRDGPRDDFERRRDDRLDDRRRDDRDRYGNRRIVNEDMRDRDISRDFRRERKEENRDSRRDDYRDMRRDENRIRSTSSDKDSRKRGLSSESEVSSNSKKSKDVIELPQSNPTVMIDDLLEPPGRDMRPEKIVIILRGLPGSGKSYLAKLIRDREAEHGGTARIMSIDDYFMQEGEYEETDPTTGKTIKKPSLKYEYDESYEETYTNSLKRAFKRSLTDGYFSFLIYDAVNYTLHSYVDIWNYARQIGFQVYICTMEQDVKACLKRNIHNRKLEELNMMSMRFFPTPAHHIQLDATTLLQSAAITDVHMEDVDDVVMDEADELLEVESVFTSKWEKMDDAGKLARLDGTSKPLRPSQLSMEDYLQLDDWTPNKAKPGKKTVRWADIEERREQEKMRAIGFVVGQTDWDRMTDPTMGSSALTQTKYIERVKRN